MVKIAFVHYSIGTLGGVPTVMRTNAIALKNIFKNIHITFIGAYSHDVITDKNVKHIDIPELGVNYSEILDFDKQNVLEYIRTGERIYKKLSNFLKNIDYVIIENPIVGLHPPATYAFYKLVSENEKKKGRTKIIYRIHDFPHDRRNYFLNLLKFTGKNKIPHWREVLFPKKNQFGYVVLNKSDSKRLRDNGVGVKNKIFIVPNSISEDTIQRDKRTSKKLRKSIIKKYNLKPDVKFLFYPVRVIPRKNIEEAIFLTQFLNKYLNENYHLLISLIDTNVSRSSYPGSIRKFVKRNNLPATLGLGLNTKRIMKGQKLLKYGIGDAYNICDKVITTSILEGFGLFFIESWYFNKAIIGRDLPAITSDFKRNGLNLKHLYSSLRIGRKDFKDIKNLHEKLKLSLKLKNKKFIMDVYRNNKQTFESLLKILKKNSNKKLIQENKKKVIKYYSSKYIARQLMKAIKTI